MAVDIEVDIVTFALAIVALCVGVVRWKHGLFGAAALLSLALANPLESFESRPAWIVVVVAATVLPACYVAHLAAILVRLSAVLFMATSRLPTPAATQAPLLGLAVVAAIVPLGVDWYRCAFATPHSTQQQKISA
jgi:short subunit fatty acids transporter